MDKYTAFAITVVAALATLAIIVYFLMTRQKVILPSPSPTYTPPPTYSPPPPTYTPPPPTYTPPPTYSPPPSPTPSPQVYPTVTITVGY